MTEERRLFRGLTGAFVLCFDKGDIQDFVMVAHQVHGDSETPRDFVLCSIIYYSKEESSHLPLFISFICQKQLLPNV